MILVLNCGSQSIKWKIFDKKLKLVKQGKREVFVSEEFDNILSDELGKITEDIMLVGHRVVYGGEFTKPLKITSENLQELEKISHLASLHNPYNILGIRTCQNIFKNIPQMAVFDTEFFKDLPERAFTYALPKNISKKFGFRRYGFHGISHEYVAKKAAETLKKPFNKLKIITCHLGGGSSITAIKNGKAIDTSMGFTPLEGLIMMTRPGNIDAGIVLERAISINNNYSNARYFLGLVYDRQKRTGDAIGQFEKIAELNPGNEEVKRILANLRSGKGALSGIAPPAKAPDKRNEPPISESSSSGNR